MLERVGARVSRRTATEHSRGIDCSPSRSDSESDYAPHSVCSAMENGLSRPLQRTGTEHSCDSRGMQDGDVRLQKCMTLSLIHI